MFAVDSCVNFNWFAVKVSDKSIAGAVDSDDEVKDIVGETRFMKPIKSIRSSSLLHSVEDLSTDSTCVYKARSGFDSNRSSRRRAAVTKPTTVAAAAPFVSTDEMLGTVSGGVAGAAAPSMQASRGLSKSMIIPTPVSDLSEHDDEEDTKKPKTCCDRIKKWVFGHGMRCAVGSCWVGFVFSADIWTSRCSRIQSLLPCACQ